MSEKYRAVIPRLQPSKDHHTVRYETGTHALQFQTNTTEEARGLVFALNQCASIDITDTELTRLQRIETMALRVVSGRRDGIVTDKTALDNLDAALEATS